MLNEDKRDKALRKLETSPRMSLAGLAQQTGVSVSLVRNETKLLHLHPRKTPAVRTLRDAYRATRLSLVTWYVYGVCAGEMELTLVLFSYIARFHFSGHETSQNIRC